MKDYLDHYCERIAPGLWGEPFNLFSNLAFILAAYAIYRQYFANRPSSSTSFWDHWLLLVLLLAIGTGSALWHLLANSWSLWSDRIPILLFINVYLLSCLFRVLRLSITSIVVVFLLYHIVNVTVQLSFTEKTLNGSLFYVPTLLFLIGISIVTWYRHFPVRLYYVIASLVFTVSLCFRTIDQTICNSFSIGTHFLWHLLNGITLYLLMTGLIKATAASELE